MTDRAGARGQPPPLAGVRVVSMALNAPGPLAVMRLAAAGASVTKIEPLTGDPMAAHCRSWYDEMHRGVRVERVDLKSAEGHARMRALLDDADLFISSQRPSALSRLGLDATSLAHVRWVNIVGEQAQPEVPGHDLTYLAQAGLLGATMPPTLVADVMGSERAVSAGLLLLRQPPGTHAEVGLFDSLDGLRAPLRHGLTASTGLLGGALPAYRIYRAREGSVAIAALEPHFRKKLYDLLHLDHDSDLTEAMKTRTADEWEQWALERDLPLSAVKSEVP